MQRINDQLMATTNNFFTNIEIKSNHIESQLKKITKDGKIKENLMWNSTRNSQMGSSQALRKADHLISHLH